LTALPPLGEVIRRHGLTAAKGLGQHFLLDLNLTRRVVRQAGNLTGVDVIEIGPGPGGLTRALLESSCRRVFAVEKDERCLEALRELASAYPGRLEVHHADALALDPGGLGTPPRQVVANLPYNIGTALLVGWLQSLALRPGSLQRLTLMFQKEVAQRLVARPDGAHYGRLAVLTQWLTRPALCFEIPASAFVPPPKVVSAVVRLDPRQEPLAPASLPELERVTAAAFGQRRKMLRQSLRTLGTDAAALLAGAGIDGQRRAETLAVEEFCALARALQDQTPPPREPR